MMTGLKCKCGHISITTSELCPHCGQSGQWIKSVRLSSLGKIVTWTILHVPPAGFSGEIPLIVLELAKEVRVLATQKERFPIRIGQKVFLEKEGEKFYITPLRGSTKKSG